MAGETSTPSANGNRAGVPGTNSIWAHLFFFLWWRLSDGCWVAETTDLLFGEWFMSKLLLLKAYKNHKIQDIHGRHSNVYMEWHTILMQSTCIWLQPGPDFPDFAMNWKIHIRTVGIRECLCTSWIGPCARYDYLSFTKSKTFESVSVFRVFYSQGVAGKTAGTAAMELWYQWFNTKQHCEAGQTVYRLVDN